MRQRGARLRALVTASGQANRAVPILDKHGEIAERFGAGSDAAVIVRCSIDRF